MNPNFQGQNFNQIQEIEIDYWKEKKHGEENMRGKRRQGGRVLFVGMRFEGRQEDENNQRNKKGVPQKRQGVSDKDFSSTEQTSPFAQPYTNILTLPHKFYSFPFWI